MATCIRLNSAHTPLSLMLVLMWGCGSGPTDHRLATTSSEASSLESVSLLKPAAAPAALIELYESVVAERPAVTRFGFVRQIAEQGAHLAAIRMRLFADVALEYERWHVASHSSHDVWTGVRTNGGTGHAGLAHIGSRIEVGGFVAGRYAYELVPTRVPGMYAILEVLRDFYESDHTDVGLPPPPLPPGPVAPQTIDILALYTPAARAAAAPGLMEPAQHSVMIGEILTAATLMNGSLNASGIPHTVAVVLAREVDWAEQAGDAANPSPQIDFLIDAINDPAHNVHADREAQNADLVNMWTVTGTVWDGDQNQPTDICGRAKAYTGSPTYDEHAVSWQKRTCQLSKYTFLHEIGHQFGAGHNGHPFWVGGEGYVAIDPVDRQVIPGFLAPAARTVMAKDTPCGGPQPDCPRIPLFSNPNPSYYFGLTMGSQAHDNALVIEVIGPVIAGLR